MRSADQHIVGQRGLGDFHLASEEHVFYQPVPIGTRQNQRVMGQIIQVMGKLAIGELVAIATISSKRFLETRLPNSLLIIAFVVLELNEQVQRESRPLGDLNARSKRIQRAVRPAE